MRMGGLCRIVAATALAGLCLAGAASADDYPSRPVTLIVPFPPGGSTNIVMRIIADKLSQLLGQQVVVDNRAGAGGTAGTRAVAKSAPDGYTIGLGYSGPLSIAPSLYPDLGYDPRKDFAPIGRVATAPNTLVVHPSFPARSIPELIAYAKANPGKLNFGSAGIGTASHLAGEYFASRAAIKLVHVPYKGTGPALTDLIGGHIPMAFAPIPASHAQAVGGTLRMLAVTSLTRSTLMPDVPTIAESGLAGYEAVLRYGLIAPAGTPAMIIARLNNELNVALASADVRARLALEGAEPLPSAPAEYAADIDREETQWSKVVRDSGAKVE
jgi:tripartite-type tricarboxylate transporter receptor subunit TctC